MGLLTTLLCLASRRDLHVGEVVDVFDAVHLFKTSMEDADASNGSLEDAEGEAADILLSPRGLIAQLPPETVRKIIKEVFDEMLGTVEASSSLIYSLLHCLMFIC